MIRFSETNDTHGHIHTMTWFLVCILCLGRWRCMHPSHGLRRIASPPHYTCTNIRNPPRPQLLIIIVQHSHLSASQARFGGLIHFSHLHICLCQIYRPRLACTWNYRSARLILSRAVTSLVTLSRDPVSQSSPPTRPPPPEQQQEQ